MNALGKPAPLAVPSATTWRGAWTASLTMLGLSLLLLGLLFAEEIVAAVRVWDNSTAYNHCWLVLPIAAWLAWGRRHRLATLLPAPAPWAALLALPLGLGWLVAERLGVMEGRQLAALALAEMLVLAVLGWRVWRAMAGPLAYLVFLVPFGAFTTPALQAVTARLIEIGLSFTGIPHYIDDLIIEIPAGVFMVAEACAGLRFLIAALAFGALYALVMFRSPWRRLAVMALALVVPILANGVRAFGIVVLGNYLGNAEAAAADHIIYGWVFFSAVILLLILLGLPFREDTQPEAMAISPPSATPRRSTTVAATGFAVGLAALGPGLAAGLDHAAGQSPWAVEPRLAVPDNCTAAGITLRCPGATVSARLMVFPTRVTWALVAAERRRLAGGSDEDATFSVSLPGSANWQARQAGDLSGSVAVAAWLAGRPAGDGLRTRATQAWNALLGSGAMPVVVAVTLQPDRRGALGPAQERAMLRAVLEAQAMGLATQAAALSAAR